MKLLNLIHAKMEGQHRGQMYMETITKGKPLKAMLDIGADMVYMAKELAEKIDLLYTEESAL